MIFSFSLDILEIPTMLFFFLHATMSFLRANTSQLSCRKHVEAKKMRIIYIIHSQTCLQIIFNAWCVGILLAQLWRAQPSLTCRGWSWTRFLWTHLWIPLWSLDEHRSVYFPIIFSLCSQNMPFLIKPRRKTSQRSHQTAAGNKPHHADAPRTWTSLKRFPCRTRSGAAGPCCCWSPLDATQHELTLAQLKKNSSEYLKCVENYPTMRSLTLKLSSLTSSRGR